MIRTQRQVNRLLGKTIREIELRKLKDVNGRTAVEPVIILEDGTRLYFIVCELEDDYAATMHEIRVGKK
jgi:hypothetical protein